MDVAERYPIFVQMATFTKAWDHHSLADDALAALEDEILQSKRWQADPGDRRAAEDAVRGPELPARQEQKLPGLLRGFHGVRLYLPRHNLYAQ